MNSSIKSALVLNPVILLVFYGLALDAQTAFPQAAASLGTQSVPSSGLVEREKFILPAPAPSILQSGFRCDSSGNMFLAYGDAAAAKASESSTLDAATAIPIRKISTSSRSAIVFSVELPPGYAVQRRYDFNLDPSGKLFELVRAYRKPPGEQADNREQELPDNLIIRFRDDGTIESTIKLDTIPGATFSALHFAPFLNGSFVVAGMSHKPGATFSEASVALFDRSGRYLKDLPANDAAEASTLGDDNSLRSRQDAARRALRNVGDISMASALDGNVYFFRGPQSARLSAVSPAGVISREIEIQGLAPLKSETTSEIGMLGPGQIFIILDAASDARNPTLTTRMAVMDSTTGEVTAVLDGTPLLRSGLLPACPAGTDQWLFLGSQNDRLVVAKFAAQ